MILFRPGRAFCSSEYQMDETPLKKGSPRRG
nr:MAG TPA: hypothetical protein [Caudoviricetes sp.]